MSNNISRLMMAIFAIIFLAACSKPPAVTPPHFGPVVERQLPSEPLIPIARSEHDRMVCVLKGLKKDFPHMTLKQQLRAARHLHYGHGQTMTVDGKPRAITRGDIYYNGCAGPTTEQLLTATTANRDYWRTIAIDRGTNLGKANGRIDEAQDTINRQGQQISDLKAGLRGAHRWDWAWAILFIIAFVAGGVLYLELESWKDRVNALKEECAKLNQERNALRRQRDNYRVIARDHGWNGVEPVEPVEPAAEA